jgi:hypothetical protein
VSLWGFEHTDIYSSFGLDLLHQDYNGMTKHLLYDALPELLRLRHGRAQADTMWGQVNDKLRQLQKLHEAFMPTADPG